MGAKATLWTVGKYLLAIGVLTYVVYANWEPAEGRGLKDVWQRHVVEREPIDGVYLLLAFVLHVLSMTITLVRWYVLVRAQELPFTLLGAFRIGMLGFLCNAFLPGAVGGDLIRATALARAQDRRAVAVATVVMDRALSLWGLIFLVALVGTCSWAFGLLNAAALGPSEVIIVTADILIGISVLVWLGLGVWPQQSTERMAQRLSSVPKVGESLSQLWQAFWLYRSRPVAIGWAVLLTTLSNVLDILVFFCYVLTLWDALPSNPLPGLAEHFLLVPIGLVISGVPLFPGGAGIGEAGFGGLYQLFDAAPANAVLGSLLFRLSGWLIGILGYVLCLAVDRPVESATA